MDDSEAVRPAGAAAEGDAGFTLIECVVALMIATLMFLALALSLGTSLKASVTARSNQRAIDLANDQLEQLRALDFAAVAIQSTDSTLATDTCTGTTSVWCLTSGGSPQLRYPNPSGGAPLTEPIYTASGGGVPAHVKQCRPNAARYTCKIYVTTPTDANAVAYRRASVVVQWTDTAGTHTRFSTTFVTAARRGLASPSYSWAPTTNSPASVPIRTGGRGAFFATLTNSGIPLRWNLGTTVTNGAATRTWTTHWYRDTDCDGSWNPATEVSTLDGDGNGVGDTGIVATDGRLCVVGVVYVPSTETLTSATVGLVATPNTAATGFTTAPPVTATATLSSTGVNFRTFSLHNWTDTNGLATADSVSAAAAPTQPQYNKLTTVAPSAAQLYNFDTDRNSAPGLTLSTGTSAVWRNVGVSGTTTLGVSGSTAYASLDFYAVSDDLNAFTTTASVSVMLRVVTPTGAVAWGSPVTVPVSGTTGFAHLAASIPVPVQTLAANDKIELTMSVPSGATPVRIAYDAAGAPATLVLPYSSGNP